MPMTHLVWTSLVLLAASMLAPSGGMTSAQGDSSQCPAAPAAVASPATPPSPSAATPAGAPVAEMNVRFGETDALIWRASDAGVILSHGAAYDAASWRAQAEAIAAAGTTVLAVEQTSPEAILSGIDFLTNACGVTRIALIGASAGAGAVFSLAASEPAAVDQLIILSAAGDVSRLGDQPKLFVASEGEGVAETARQMAEDALGADNEALILPGDAHAQAIFQTETGDDLLRAILDRLD
ncbi:MAG: alpha/beta hydrolase [Chloroflexota bacterium]|nr:alpha/beta hydrolase [Chloroflexota bacterium]